MDQYRPKRGGELVVKVGLATQKRKVRYALATTSGDEVASQFRIPMY
jgi:hypothetical protein